MTDTAARSSPPDGGSLAAIRIVAADPDGSARDIAVDELPTVLAAPNTHVWIDLVEASSDDVARIARALGLHPLVVEDIVERNQRAKFEEVDGLIHVVFFALGFAGEVHAMEIDVALGQEFLLTVHDATWDPRRAPHLRAGVGPLLARGPDYLLWALGDWVVDGYFPVLDGLAEEIDELQDEVVERASRRSLERLSVLKRELIAIRRAVSPAREIFNQLTNRQTPLVREAHVIYLRDVYDHLIRATDELDNYRELVGATLDIYLSTVNNNLSLIMKRLTGVTVILAGIGAVAGIFGMSEAGAALAGGEAVGFWVVTGAIAAAAALVLVVLRRIDWI